MHVILLPFKKMNVFYLSAHFTPYGSDLEKGEKKATFQLP